MIDRLLTHLRRRAARPTTSAYAAASPPSGPVHTNAWAPVVGRLVVLGLAAEWR